MNPPLNAATSDTASVGWMGGPYGRARRRGSSIPSRGGLQAVGIHPGDPGRQRTSWGVERGLVDGRQAADKATGWAPHSFVGSSGLVEGREKIAGTGNGGRGSLVALPALGGCVDVEVVDSVVTVDEGTTGGSGVGTRGPAPHEASTTVSPAKSQLRRNPCTQPLFPHPKHLRKVRKRSGQDGGALRKSPIRSFVRWCVRWFVGEGCPKPGHRR